MEANQGLSCPQCKSSQVVSYKAANLTNATNTKIFHLTKKPTVPVFNFTNLITPGLFGAGLGFVGVMALAVQFGEGAYLVWVFMVGVIAGLAGGFYYENQDLSERKKGFQVNYEKWKSSWICNQCGHSWSYLP